MSKPPFIEIALAPPRVQVRRPADGTILLEAGEPLAPYERSLGELLSRWAADTPDRICLAERAGDGWRRVSYADTVRSARAVAQALLDRGLGPERPVLILSGNAIDHALLMFGGFLAGVPVVPVSVAYSLMSRDHAKLRHIAAQVRPGLVYAADGGTFASALAALDWTGGVELVTGTPPADRAATPFAALLATIPTGAVDRAAARVGPDDVAKILYTSGSTGLPKGVINTHRMLCANQQSLAQIWPFTADTPPVLVDWLPWNHTFGGNHNLNLVLKRGGTLYIDGGRPLPGQFEPTVRNLAEIAPTIYFNVPAGYAMLVPELERDPALARTFFSRLQLIFYAAAALPQDLWERLEALSVRTRGRRVLMTASWGSTETAPLATAAHFPIERAGVIGVPVPGCTLKLVPNGAKLEVRVRGPNVCPGYIASPDLTAQAFDADGFYRIGDAVRLADPADPSRGLVFDGRIAEDFKLATGTWVSVGTLRVAALTAAAPVLQDALVAGHDRDYVALLAWVSRSGAATVCADADRLDADALCRHAAVRDHVRQRLGAYNQAAAGGSSVRIRRVLLMAEPPSIDANEVTDKGYINQRAALARRATLVEQVYRNAPDAAVIEID